ncbi:MAG: hypothetical protein E7415_07065 [Ruminococcaceae bacterium]|nr:hypothetical protein [Oscillospiraceae bacterium]
MTSTKVILKYRRDTDAWVCPVCDMENNATVGKCILCQGNKAPDSRILKQWKPEDDVIRTHNPTPPPTTPPYGTAPRGTSPYGTSPYRTSPYGTSPGGYPPAEYNNNTGKIILITILIIAAIVLLFYFAVESRIIRLGSAPLHSAVGFTSKSVTVNSFEMDSADILWNTNPISYFKLL